MRLPARKFVSLLMTYQCGQLVVIFCYIKEIINFIV